MNITGLLLLRNPAVTGILGEKKGEKRDLNLWGQGTAAKKGGGSCPLSWKQTGSTNLWQKRTVLYPFPLQCLECFPTVRACPWPWCCGESSKPPLSPSTHSCFNNCGTLLLEDEVNELCTAQAAQAAQASQLGLPFDRKKCQMCLISCTAFPQPFQ